MHATKTLLAIPAAATVAALVVLTGCVRRGAMGTSNVQRASATLRDATGQTVGSARFMQQGSDPVQLEVDVHGLAPGAHGIHIHTVGSCDASGATAFGAAGAHFNPRGMAHGLQNPNGPHAGDLPNLEVRGDGTGHLSATSDRISLASGATTSLFDADGSALVIHAGPDDQMTDPAGNSGARVACGVIQQQQ